MLDFIELGLLTAILKFNISIDLYSLFSESDCFNSSWKVALFVDQTNFFFKISVFEKPIAIIEIIHMPRIH